MIVFAFFYIHTVGKKRFMIKWQMPTFQRILHQIRATKRFFLWALCRYIVRNSDLLQPANENHSIMK